MKAWRLERLGGALGLEDVPTPEPRPGSVLVRIEASVLMSYLKPYVEGKLPVYRPPPGPFTLGTNGVGVVAAGGPRSLGPQTPPPPGCSSPFVPPGKNY